MYIGCMARLCRVFSVLVLLLALVGCSPLPVSESPFVIHENAHSGGSVVAFDVSGQVLASGGWEGRVRLWDTVSGGHIRSWPAHSDSVNGIAFLNDERELISAGYDGRIIRWSVDGGLLQSVDTGVPITHMVAHVASDRLLTGHNDGTVQLWRLADLAVIETRRLHARAVRAVAIGERGQYASSGVDGAVYLWRERAAEQRLADPPVDAWTLAFSPDEQRLMGGGWFRLFRWELHDASVSVVPTRHRGIIRSIVYLPGSHLLASISRQTDSAVYLLDPETGAIVRRFRPHDLCGASIALSPDGHYLATTSDDASVRIWDLTTR